ncbi:glycosyltransferase [Vibrio alginolyticus]|uniref:glycosyltransferase n=1 Tax=Vibrio alginolyticus TaxID=663 RepID=UPI00375461B0
MLTHYIESIRPGGGPRGYLYNLSLAIDEFGSNSIQVIAEERSEARSNSKSKQYNVLDLILRIFYFLIVGYSKRHIISDDKYEELKKADVVVFHRASHLYSYLKKNDFSKGQKIGIMPHNPMSPAEESVEVLCSNISPKFKFLARILLKVMVKQEIKIFEQADFIIAPNRNACDAYYKDFPRIKSLFSKLNFSYLETGVKKCTINKSKSVILQELGINNSTPKIGYFGRLESVKGYDKYKKLASTTPDKYFISAGIGSLASSDSSVHELGWRTDVHDIINAVDIIIVPNKVAYFDLIILECLSLGKTVITSNVGGSKLLNCYGVLTYENYPELESLISKPINELIRDESVVKKEFDKRFSLKSFLNSYEKLEGSLKNG